MEFLDINVTKDSSLLLHGFKNTYKKIHEKKSNFL